MPRQRMLVGTRRLNVRGRILPVTNRRSVATKGYVKNIVGRGKETKVSETSTTSEISTTAVIVKLSAVSQGDGGNERIGDRFDLVHLQLFGHLESKGASVAGANRIIVFQWKHNDTDKVPVVGDILNNPGSSDPHSSYNYDLRKEYNILFDRTYGFSGHGVYNQRPLVKIMIPSKKLVKKVINEPAINTGLNHIYMLLLGENATGADALNFTWFYQQKYKDS